MSRRKKKQSAPLFVLNIDSKATNAPLTPTPLRLYHGRMIQKYNDPDWITYFAITNYRDIRRLFGIKEKNRRAHIYIIGKTGTGKSTLIENMVMSDIKDGNGVALIDPHGDLAEKILALIPLANSHHTAYTH